MNKVKTKIYLSKTINQCNAENIESTVCGLFKRFTAYREIIIDLYILKAEKLNQTHEKQRKKYYYNSELNRTGSKKKHSQHDLIQKLKNNR